MIQFNPRRLYLKTDIEPIDYDILRKIKTYDLINEYSDNDGIFLNIYIADMEKWLSEQIENDTTVLTMISERFNVSPNELKKSPIDYELCFLIFFLEFLKQKKGMDAEFSIFSEAVLYVNSEIIDDLNQI